MPYTVLILACEFFAMAIMNGHRSTLSQLYSEHKGKVSDKWALYISEYDRLFREYCDKPIKLLEIGVQNGGSLEIWSEYFRNASVIIGCDVDSNCAALCYDNPRIVLVIGDANSLSACEEILSHSPEFDIVIDDGSHRSDDIIRSFLTYFPKIVDGGIYIVEDIHASYWKEFGGGLFDPFSSLSFFKRLLDIINYEHWGIERTCSDILRGFQVKHNLVIDEEIFGHIHSIEFVNSLCFIHKRCPANNTLQERIIAGNIADVAPGIQGLRDARLVLPTQTSNPWSTRIRPPDEEIIEREQQVQSLSVQLAEREQELQALQARLKEEKEQLIQQVAEKEQAVQVVQTKLEEREQELQALQARLKEEKEQLIQQVAEKGQAVQELQAQIDERDHDLQSLRTRVAQAEAQVRLIQSSLVFLLLSKFRSAMGRLLPHGTRRRRGYNLLVKGLRIVLAEGPGGLCRRIRARRARIAPKDDHSQLSSQDHCSNEESWESRPKSSSTITQQVYVEAYASSLSAARGREGEGYVPLTEEEFPAELSPVKLIAFYLPQFHPIPENDQWWGKGFTEWTNVSKAVPQFVGHYQPHLPGELGFYDLRVPAVQRRQVELAKKYGIYGFCFYYYWFNGKRLLERPLGQFLADQEIDLPFCLCWANENWTRTWDGAEHDVLIAQEHSAESDVRFIQDVMPLLQHERYIRIHGRPLLIVYRAQDLPNPAATANRWKRICRSRGVAEPYLVAAQTFNQFDPRKVGFDAAVQFPPHGLDQWDISTAFKILNSDRSGRIYNYLQAVEHMTRHEAVPYHVFRTVMPSWDNEPRKPGAGHSFVFSSPCAYREWLIEAGRRALQETDHEKHIVFINAWNEWGEGTHLEPDRRYGYAYLQATAAALRSLVISSDENSHKEAAEPFDSRLVKRHDTAVILHLYYTDLWEKIPIYLESLGGDFDLYVSLPNESSFKAERIRDKYPHAHIYHCENRGRDIAPFLEIFQAIYPLRYKFICKIHTKKSGHREDGDSWRRELFSGLLGSCDVVQHIKLLIDTQPDLGIVTAKKHLISFRSFQAKNLRNVVELARMAGLPYDGEDFRFAAGSMFWFRASALRHLTLLPITTAQFEPEQGQKDGTLAHAFERFICLLPVITGFRVIGVADGGKEQLSVGDNLCEYEYAEPTIPTDYASEDK